MNYNYVAFSLLYMLPHKNEHPIADGGTMIEVNYSDIESPTYAVVKGLAALKGIADTDVGPLYDQIQTEAMDRLLHHAQVSGCYVGLEFKIAKYTVLVRSDEQVLIYEDDPVTDNVEVNW